jgi:dsRNA-specific ribonuclease
MESSSYKESILEIINQKKSTTPLTLNEIPNKHTYDPSLMSSFNKYALHNPMRKLFNSLLFFLTEYSEHGDVCICHSSEAGIYLDAIFKLFPRIKFIVINNDNLWGAYTNVKCIGIINNERDMQILSKYVDKGVLYFYGDSNPVTRKTTRDAFSKQELELQRKIIEYITPKKYNIRFNPPATENGKKSSSFDYLAGEVFLQPYNKLSSSETRLIGDTLHSKVWDLDDYFNRIFYFATFLREWQFYTVDSIQTKGGDNCFDCAFEDKICTNYMEKYQHDFVNTQEMRDWISNFDGSLSLYTEKGYFMKNNNKIYWEDFLSQYKIRDFTTKMEPKNDKHGSLPRTNIDELNNYLTPASRYQITFNNIKSYANLNMTSHVEQKLKHIIKENDMVIRKSMTHKSINPNPQENYEEGEIVGDALLRSMASEYIVKYYGNGTNPLGTLSNLVRYLTTGTQSTEVFAKMTRINEIILAKFEESDEKILEDVFESYLYALKVILDKYGDETQPKAGYDILRRMVFALFDKIHLDRIEIYEIFPPKTALKELFDEKSTNLSDPNHIYWDMAKVYTRLDSRGIKITKNKLDEWSRPQITIRLQFDKKSGIDVLSYTATGPPKYVEFNACKAFLEYLHNRDHNSEPRHKYIIVRN